MKKIFDRIAFFAAERPELIALSDDTCTLSYGDLHRQIDRVAAALTGKRIGLLLANSCAWAVADLAIQRRGIPCIPLPPFFSDAQLRHVIDDAGLDVIITDQATRVIDFLRSPRVTELAVAGKVLDCLTITPGDISALPPHTAKITYTSGTTGQAKGVCLGCDAMEGVALSLSEAVAATAQDRSLCLLPLSTLLANIGGIYAPLYAGGTAFLPDLASCGMSGSTGARHSPLMAALQRYQPTVTALVPHLLKILVEAVAQGEPLPSSLRYIAVGGAPTAQSLIDSAWGLGLPVYQGYGLSEAASVVSLNLPDFNRTGSAGRPLPPAKLRIAADGEIMVGGNLFTGYLGEAPRNGKEWPSGDTGFIDGDGYLHITGRKKTAFATAHGRNVSPEWIESELTADPAIAQAALFGEGRPFNVAVVVPREAAAVMKIGRAIARINETLPDYARASRWIIAEEPFTPHNGLVNGTGALNRNAIAAKYAVQIERFYEREKSHAIL